jgi:hypothetical protein
LLDRKFKPLPPDPGHHQDSAIAPKKARDHFLCGFLRPNAPLCAYVRCHVRRSLGERHEEPRSEDRRQESGDHLNGSNWQRFAQESGLNPRQVVERVSTLAKSAIEEAAVAELEVAAMPAGEHAILSQTRQAIERRAHLLLAQLHEAGDEPATEAGDENRLAAFE